MTAQTPIAATKPPKRPGENGFKYRQQFGLVVPCRDEAHQRRLFTRFSKLGIKSKVVCV